jgi:hypothetical protein
MRVLGIIALAGVVMFAAVLSREPLFLGFAVFFVPGGVLVYYLRDRGVFKKTASPMFLMLLSVAVSFIVSGLNSQLITPGVTLGTERQDFLIVGLSLAWTGGLVLLVEFMLPHTIPDAWALKPWAAMIAAVSLVLVGSLAGIAGFARHAWWLAASVVAVVPVAGLFWYRRVVCPAPRAQSVLAFCALSWLLVMTCAALIQALPAL